MSVKILERTEVPNGIHFFGLLENGEQTYQIDGYVVDGELDLCHANPIRQARSHNRSQIAGHFETKILQAVKDFGGGEI